MFFQQGQKGNNKWWIYMLTIFLVLFAYTLGQVPLMIVAQVYIDRNRPDLSIEDFFTNPDFSSIGMSTNLGFLLLLVMFVAAILALYLSVTVLHKKPFQLLIHAAKSISWSRILFGFFLWLALIGLTELPLYFQNPGNYILTFDTTSFIPLFLISLLILPIQTSFEEVFFRGYLLQGLYLIISHKWAVIVITSLLFMFVHGTNPEIETFGFGIMMAYYFTAGLILAIVTSLDNRLELALGMHAAMNFFGAVFIGYSGGVLQTDSILKATEINPKFMLIGLIISGVIFIAISYKKFSWKIRRLFETDRPENHES